MVETLRGFVCESSFETPIERLRFLIDEHLHQTECLGIKRSLHDARLSSPFLTFAFASSSIVFIGRHASQPGTMC